MNELIYSFRDNKVRVIMQGEVAWFCAKDVCGLLELSNVSMVVGRLEEDEVTKFNLGGLMGSNNFVNEYGLYSLILGSRKPEAKEFKRWITHEVIPSIRKTGSYSKPMSQMEMIATMAQQYVEQEKAMKITQERVQAVETKQEQIVDVLSLNTTNWRNDANHLINDMVRKSGKGHSSIRNESYESLERRVACKLSVRLNNLKKRMERYGATKSRVDKANRLDAIGDDARLLEIYFAIIKEMAIVYK